MNGTWKSLTTFLLAESDRLDGFELKPVSPMVCPTVGNPVEFFTELERKERLAVDAVMVAFIREKQLTAGLDRSILAWARQRFLYGALASHHFDWLYTTECAEPTTKPTAESRLSLLLISLWPEFGWHVWKARVESMAQGICAGKLLK